jgi:hypothetical protein
MEDNDDEQEEALLSDRSANDVRDFLPGFRLLLEGDHLERKDPE